jgi:hypothetical protein
VLNLPVDLKSLARLTDKPHLIRLPRIPGYTATSNPRLYGYLDPPTEIVTRYPQSADYHLGARVMSLQLCLTRLRSRSSGMGRLSTVARPKIRCAQSSCRFKEQTRMCRFPASGSSWESLARGGADDTIRDSPAKKLLSSSCRAKHPALPPGLRGGIRGACSRRRALPRGERRPAPCRHGALAAAVPRRARDARLWPLCMSRV